MGPACQRRNKGSLWLGVGANPPADAPLSRHPGEGLWEGLFFIRSLA
jgi:hypothetical protein